jgi:transcription elongation factor GreB
LRDQLQTLSKGEPTRSSKTKRDQQVADLMQALAFATIVRVREDRPEEVLFGATVTVRGTSGGSTRYRIVGVDETQLEPGWVSWVSPLGKALIGLQVGERLRLPDAPPGEEVEIVEIVY